MVVRGGHSGSKDGGPEAQGGWDWPGLQQAPMPYLPKKQEEVKVQGPPVPIFQHWGYKYTVHLVVFFFLIYMLVFTEGLSVDPWLA